MVDRLRITQEEAVERLGKSRPAIANALDYYNYQNQYRIYLLIIAYCWSCQGFTSIENEKLRDEIAAIIKKNLSVRENEKLVQSLNKSLRKQK